MSDQRPTDRQTWTRRNWLTAAGAGLAGAAVRGDAPGPSDAPAAIPEVLP